jgi:hypothetical protein
MSRKYFVFRINYDDDEAHRWVLDELLKGSRLRQGWGAAGLQLLTASGDRVARDTWLAAYKSKWNDPDEEILRRHDILSRMTEVRPGDLLVVPKTLDWNTLTICEAQSGYRFDSNSKTHWDDFKHYIEIRNPKSYRYASSGDASLLSAKFKAYQSAVNNVWNVKTIEAIETLYAKPSSEHDKTIDVLRDELLESALAKIADKLLDLEPAKFEDLIVACLIGRGYQIIGRRKYDGEGADADIVASYPLPYFSELADDAPIILIQVKKKRGTDRGDVEGVEQLVKSGRTYPNSIRILINTSDAISLEAAELAAREGVRILHGPRVIDFVMTSQLVRTSSSR